MNNYLAVMQTAFGGLAWHHNFSQPSDMLALEYARRIAHELRSYSSFMGLTIFAKGPIDPILGETVERTVGSVIVNQLKPVDTMSVVHLGVLGK